MAEYESNGEFSYSGDGSSDFKRDYKRDGAANSPKSDDDNDEGLPVSEKVNDYIRDLLSEKVGIDHKYPNAEKLLDQGKFTKIDRRPRWHVAISLAVERAASTYQCSCISSIFCTSIWPIVAMFVYEYGMQTMNNWWNYLYRYGMYAT